MKKHVTVKLTAAMLRRHEACEDGMNAIRPLLPLKLSTNPEENVEIALQLVDSRRALIGFADANWAALEFTGGWTWAHKFACGYTHHARDPFQTMQWLAWIADAIATKQGR